jgi:polyvinyl alcohol dehydrogenase (cytochrome)
MSRTWRAVGALAVGLTLTTSCSSDKKSTPLPTTTTVAGAVATESSAEDWTAYGHDLANSRVNPHETQITRATVKNLDVAWSKKGLTGVTGTPTVADGVVYFPDWTGKARAVDAATGKEKWVVDVGSRFMVGSTVVAGDAVYVATGATLMRLDRATGRSVWKTTVNDHAFAQINASPVVVDDLVLQGTASAEVAIAMPQYSFRGTIGAYDATTGKERWRFYTTNNDARGGPGVGIWSTPAVDRERALLYVGSGNAYAEPTGPLADSILAIDYKTGKLKWSTQFTNPDVFSAGNPKGPDADVGASPNMWTVAGRDFVGAGDKAGVFHALDRSSGKVVWERKLTPGGFFGGEIGSGALVDGRLVVVSNEGDAATANSPTNVAKVYALDPETGKVLWQAKPLPQKVFGPVSAVPGIAFVGTTAGTYVALDTGSGNELWKYQAPGMVGGGASIVDGRVHWGYGFVLFSGGGDGGILSFRLPS